MYFFLIHTFDSFQQYHTSVQLKLHFQLCFLIYNFLNFVLDRANVSCLLHLQHSSLHLVGVARHLDLLHPQDRLQGSVQWQGKRRDVFGIIWVT